MSTPLEAIQPIQEQSMDSSGLVGHAAMTSARFFLGLLMIPYALDKLVVYQFKVPAWSYAHPLGATSGNTLVWATYGYSPRLQILLGLFELIPAALLLNVRTRRLGALFMFPVLLNVVLLNFSLDIGRGTKIVSSTLLAVNVFLILYDGPVYLNLFKGLITSPRPIASRRLRLTAKISSITVMVVAIVFSASAITYSIVHFQIPVADFTGMPQINGSGTWGIDSLTIAGRPVTPDPDAWFFFNVFNTCEYGSVRHPSFGTFEADKSLHTFQINRILLEGSTSTIKGTYQLQGDRLLLNGTRNNLPLSLTLKRVYPYNGW